MAMIYEGNKVNQIRVDTPVGLTDPVRVEKILTQGGSLGPRLCSVQVDDIGRDIMEEVEKVYNNQDDVGKDIQQEVEHIYWYKDEVGVPPLGLIDDVLDISECGVDSVIDNAYIVARFDMDKLQLNKSKCHQLHIGKVDNNCPDLEVHSEVLEKVEKDKYLGD